MPQQALAVLERGLAVFCQKPLARDAPCDAAVVDAARGRRRPARRRPLLSPARRRPAAPGRASLGRPAARSSRSTSSSTTPTGRTRRGSTIRRSSGGGCVLDLGDPSRRPRALAARLPAMRGAQPCVLERPPLTRRARVEDYAAAPARAGRRAPSCGSPARGASHAGRDCVSRRRFYGDGGAIALRNVDGSFYDFAAERREGTRRRARSSRRPTTGAAAPPSRRARRATATRPSASILAAEGVIVAVTPGGRPDPRTVARRSLMTADAVGGVWTYSLELADALSARGVEVWRSRRWADALTRAAPGAGCRRDVRSARVPTARWSGWSDPWQDVRARRRLAARPRRTARARLVHLNGYVHAAAPWKRAASWSSATRDVLSWHDAVRGHPARLRCGTLPRGRGARARVPRICWWRRRRRCSTSSSATTGPRVPTRVVANGVAPEPSAVREAPFVLAAGRLWDEAKNVEALVRVAPRLAWPVVSRRRRLSVRRTQSLRRASASSTRRAQRGRAIGWRARRSSALPARYEPFGLAAAGGGAARCALVLGDIPSLREVLGRTQRCSSRRTTTTRSRHALGASDRDAGAPATSCASRALQTRCAFATRPSAWPTGTSTPTRTRSPAMPDRHGGNRHAGRRLLPLAALRLEPRQRALPARRRRASCSRAATTCGLRAARRLEPDEPRWREHGAGGRSSELPSRVSASCASRRYDLDTLDLDAALDGADLVLVHEWNDPRARAPASASAARPTRFLPPAVPRHASPLGDDARRRWPRYDLRATTACSPSAR